MSNVSPEEFQAWLKGKPVRYAKVYTSTMASAETVARYLPANYQVIEQHEDYVIITGADNAGWTLEGYVIPRLGSGLIRAEELKTVKAEVYHNVSRDASFGLNTVFHSTLDPKATKQQAQTREEQHPLVKVFEYRTWFDSGLQLCERAFAEFNNGSGQEDPDYFARKLRSLSVGDVIVIGGGIDPVAYSCESAGFRERDISELRIITDYDPVRDWGGRVITVPWE